MYTVPLHRRLHMAGKGVMMPAVGRRVHVGSMGYVDDTKVWTVGYTERQAVECMQEVIEEQVVPGMEQLDMRSNLDKVRCLVMGREKRSDGRQVVVVRKARVHMMGEEVGAKKKGEAVKVVGGNVHPMASGEANRQKMKKDMRRVAP